LGDLFRFSETPNSALLPGYVGPLMVWQPFHNPALAARPFPPHATDANTSDLNKLGSCVSNTWGAYQCAAWASVFLKSSGTCRREADTEGEQATRVRRIRKRFREFSKTGKRERMKVQERTRTDIAP
jgi:hypothetical protein